MTLFRNAFALSPPALLLARAAPPSPGALASLCLIVTYFLLQMLAGGLMVLLIGLIDGNGLSWGSATQVTRNLVQRPTLQALLAVVSLGVAAPLTFFLAYRRWPLLWSLPQPPGFGFTLPLSKTFFAWGVAIGLLAPVLGGVLTQLLAQGHAQAQDIQQLGTQVSLPARLPLILVVTCIGPLAEELLFRGVLLSALLRRWRVEWAVGACSLTFALIHLPGLHYQWFALPNLLLLAVALAWLRLRSGSIWPSMLAHGINNLLAVLVWFAASQLPG